MTYIDSGLCDEELRALGLGFTGAHRTGKTTLARRLADKNKCPFVTSSMSAIADSMGIKIGLDMPFAQRVALQDRALDEFENAYKTLGEGQLFVTDRTPIDLAAYVITAWHPSVCEPEHADWANDYLFRCLEVTNRWFFQISIIQPADIPYVDAVQKGENIDFYREALNSTMIGVSWMDECRPTIDIVPRDVLSIEDRAKWVSSSYSTNITEYSQLIRQSHPVQ